MNKQFTTTLKYLLSGILLVTAATTHAQNAGDAHSSDSTRHHYRQNSDRQNFAHRGGNNGGQQDHARFDHNGGNFAHRGGNNGWGNSGAFNRSHIRYTPEQRKQLMAINKDYRQKRADLFKQDNLTLKQYKAGLVALEKEKKSKTQGLLTPQQKDEVAAGRKRMDENRQVREVAHLERLKLHLNLTDDQLAKIKAGNENLRTEARAIHEDDNLLPQQKMAQMKTLMAKRNDTYKSVLTPDQYTQFEKMMSHRRAGGGFRGSRTI
jgi:hypothetical protein